MSRILKVCAAICFALAVLSVGFPVDLIALGLFLWVLSTL